MVKSLLARYQQRTFDNLDFIDNASSDFPFKRF